MRIPNPIRFIQRKYYGWRKNPFRETNHPILIFPTHFCKGLSKTKYFKDVEVTWNKKKECPNDKHDVLTFTSKRTGRTAKVCFDEVIHMWRLKHTLSIVAANFEVHHRDLMNREEGDLCKWFGCHGRLEVKKAENCSCHIDPPCSGCVDAPLWCPVCEWEEEK